MTDLPEETVAPTDTPVAAVAPVAGAAPRPGIPVWRVGKPDAVLAAQVSAARDAVLSIATDADIGQHLGSRSEGMRCVTHLFKSAKPGYRGWVWFASLSRVSRSKTATVNEVGLLPTGDSVLAPAWVPWSERVRPEDQQEADDAARSGGQPVVAEDPAQGDFHADLEATPETDAAGQPAGVQDAWDDAFDNNSPFAGNPTDGDTVSDGDTVESS